MRPTEWKRISAVMAAMLVTCMTSSVLAQTTQLATWDTPPTGTVFPGGDFDPNLDNAGTCSGCWFGRPATSATTYSYSTAQKTQGTGALKANIVGKGLGGSYSPTINGAPFPLTTHFDYPLTATYISTPGTNGGVVDSRFTAIQNAVNGNQALYTINFDIIYDVAQMRSIPWQPPEETVDPINNGQYPQRFFWVGMYGNSSAGPFTFTGFDQNNINVFDPQWDNNLFPVFNASFPLTAFNFVPNAGQTNFAFGFLYNSVFGTSPPSANTAAATVYFDNLRLVQFNPAEPIDFNDNGVADPGDFKLFMGQYGLATPTFGDLVGNFGAGDPNGVVDFSDLQRFQQLYQAANPGAGSLSASVPEPSTLALLAVTLLGFFGMRTRRSVRPFLALAIGVSAACTQQTAHAQLVESFETIGKWAANPNPTAGTNPSVTLGTIGATQGTKSLKVTASDTAPPAGFSWNAQTSPNWVAGDAAFDALKNAIRIGPEHFNLMAETTFNPAELPGINGLTVTLGLNFNGQTIATYAGETSQFTTTATIPLSSFNLPDTIDQGTTGYSGQIGFTVTSGDVDPFAVYVDNIRLVQISTPDLLTLEINRANGAGTLKNLTANPIAWNYLELRSTGASLDASGWSSLDDQNADGVDTWIEAGGSSATRLVEASLLGNHTLAPGASLPLGNLYNEGVNAQDLALMIRRTTSPTNRTYDQIVTYIGTAPVGVAGDYNNNQVVDAADYTIWRDHLGQTFQLQNEGGTSPGVVDQADYNFWKTRFGATSGGGSNNLSAVPEPSSFALCFCVIVATSGGRRRRSPLAT